MKKVYLDKSGETKDIWIQASSGMYVHNTCMYTAVFCLKGKMGRSPLLPFDHLTSLVKPEINCTSPQVFAVYAAREG